MNYIALTISTNKHTSSYHENI